MRATIPLSADLLRSDERQMLQTCEALISDGLDSFLRTGEALRIVRENQLYRETYRTFDEYTEQRWQISARRARQLMSAFEIVQSLKSGTIVPLLPTTESQVRPISSLPPEDQREAWAEAVSTAPIDAHGRPRVTAAHVVSVVKVRQLPEFTVDKIDERIPVFDYSARLPPQSPPRGETTLVDAVCAIQTAFRGGYCAKSAYTATTAALSVFKRRRQGTSLENFGDCVQRLLEIVEALTKGGAK
jgi:hypothetical protein